MKQFFLWTSILIGLAMSARAEPDAVAQWLMNEPVTLWDRGMERAQRVAKDAGRVVVDDLGVAWIYTRYHWDNNEIDINLDVDEFPSPLTHELCNQTRRSFMAEIAGSALKPAVIPAGSDLAAAAAAGVDPGLLERKKGELGRALLHDLINQWFSHDGITSSNRDENLAEKLARIIFVKVSLRNNNGGIECRERIMTFDAPSKPFD